MKIVKHDFVENYLSFSEDERQDVLLQEVSKAIMMFPNAIKDILTNEKITPKTNKPNDLLDAIVSNSSNYSLMTKLAKISMVTNMELQKNKGVDKDISYRRLMNDKSEFLKANEDILKDSVIKFKNMLHQKGYQKKLAQSVNEYLNMDGQNSNQVNMNTNQTNGTTSKEKVGFTPTTLLVLGITIFVAIALAKNDK
jgi:hypothetical protein